MPPFDETTINYLAYGDSKTLGTTDGDYEKRLYRTNTPGTNLREVPTRIAVSGGTVAIMQGTIDADLAAASGTPQYIFFNLGANDAGALPVEATWKGNLRYIVRAMHTKWPTVPIYTMDIWNRAEAANSATLNAWYADIRAEAEFSVYVFQGPDETVFLENGDNGATYMADDKHPNAAGFYLTASQWRATIGV